MTRRRADGWPAPVAILAMGAVGLISGEYAGAMLMFLIALVALVNMMPLPDCCQDCGQGRRPCKRRAGDKP